MKSRRLFIFLYSCLIFIPPNVSAKSDQPGNKNNLASADTLVKTIHCSIDSSIRYTAKDSMIMILEDCNTIYLLGEGSVQYKNMHLTGEYIEVQADSNIIFATYGLDSLGNAFGYPLLKENETQYEMKKVYYNFKTKKMFIHDIITQQGEGYITAAKTKKMPNDNLFIKNGRYTTCNEHDHPHFYLQLTKAKINKKMKRVITGPAYLVVEGVPFPIAIPFGFFPLSHERYASGIIMPSYGDEMERGFSLTNGGYYFALNQYMDLSLIGEIFTKGSWGLDVSSTYRKRYKTSGNIQVSYRKTIIGEEKDYRNTKDFKFVWIHCQNVKANPFNTFSSNVNFSTSSYNQNDLEALYSGLYTQNSKFSSINYSYRRPESLFSFNLNAFVNQTSQSSTLSLDLPNITIFMRDTYPFRKKDPIETIKWYENVSISYKGILLNNIRNVKEDEFFRKNFLKNWKNGIKHEVPINASFNLLKNITIIPSVNYIERWYFNRILLKYDPKTQQLIPSDTTYHFCRIYNYSVGISATTKLYGTFKPWNFFGPWTKKTQIRHVLTPSFSLIQSPDFSHPKYRFYKIVHSNDNENIKYSPFTNNLWSIPEQGKTGILNFTIDNNLEMKCPLPETDSVRKISLIDQLRLNMSYNFLEDSMKWSDLSIFIRFKVGTYTLGIQGTFDPYLYEKENKINVLRWNSGKGIVRLKSMETSFSYKLSSEVFKKWFKRNDRNDSFFENEISYNDIDSEENNDKSYPLSFRGKQKKPNSAYDSDGYLSVYIPWSLNLNYFLSLDYDWNSFHLIHKEYPYKIYQALGICGSIRPTKNWSFDFNANYDFEHKKIATLNCSILRKMHCWTMSANIIPIGPYQSYHFIIAVNSSVLKDLKYTQSSNFRDAVNWGNEK